MALATEISEHYLTCTVCMDVFVEPKALPCLHTFCLKCLEAWAMETVRPDKPYVTCPYCHAEHVIPDFDQGVGSFHDNHMIISLIDTVKNATKDAGENEDESGPIDDDEKDASLIADSENSAENGVTSQIHFQTQDPPPSYNAEISPGEIVDAFASYGHNPRQLCNPVGMTVTDDGFTAVAESQGNRVIVFTPAGEPQWAVRCQHRVHDVYYHNGGLLVAVSKAGGVIGHLYNKYGRLLEQNPRGQTFRYSVPHSMAMYKNKVVFTSSEDNNIHVLSKWRSTHTWNTIGHSKGRCAITRDGDIIFLDYLGHLGKVYAIDGEKRFTFGHQQNCGRLRHPTDVCVDDRGNMIVADYDNYRVAVFSDKGKYLYDAVADTGRMHGIKPRFIAWNPSTSNLNVLVTSNGWLQIRVYKYRTKRFVGSLKSSVCVML